MAGSGIRARTASGIVLLTCLVAFSSCSSGFNILSFQGEASWESLVDTGDRAYRSGDYDKAVESYEGAVRLAEGELIHRNRLSSALNKLGQASMALEDYDEAEEAFNQALETDREIYGGPHTAIGVDLNNLGLLSYHRREYEEAEAFYRESLAQYTTSSDEDRLGKSTSMMNLALVYCEDNRYSDAIPLLAGATDIRRQILGAEHPEVAVVQSNLGMAYIGTEEYDEAERCLKESLAVLRDRDTALKLASLYRFLNREDAAERIARRYGV